VLSVVAELPEFCTRLASGGNGEVLVLSQNGAVYRLDAKGGAVFPIIAAGDYLDPARGSVSTSGLARDAEGRLWIVCNQRIAQATPYQNEITIYRTSETVNGYPAKPKLWFRTSYPYGIGSFNHGVSHLAFGPDGLLYVSSGSRTDGGEPGRDEHYYKGGETALTACMWRLDPKAAEPKIEVVARGLRNTYGFTWDGAGRLWSVDNGPDANAPEEMNLIEPGRHYGFPFQFSDWKVEPGKPYAHTPPAPPGVSFTLPVVNEGPAAGGMANGLATFDPHSSPAGMVWCGDEYAPPLRGGFVVTRFGNLLGPPAAPQDVGFDVLLMKVREEPAGHWRAECTSLLAPLGRPLDVLPAGGGKLYLLEYTRPTDFRNQLAWLPGRIVQLAPAK
jgi:glucose/arabinose dehydrogenase